MSLGSRSKMNSITFFLLWVIINAGGWLTFIFLTNRLYTILASALAFNSADIAAYFGFFIIGGAMGFLQWLLLRLQFSIVWYEWITASAIGFGFGLIGNIWATLLDHYIVVSFPSGPLLEWDPLIGGLLLGLVLGCCQSVVWRPHFWHIIAWIGVNVVGWSLGLFLADVATFLLYDIAGSKNLIYLDFFAPVVFITVLTGIVLIFFSARCAKRETAVTLPA